MKFQLPVLSLLILFAIDSIQASDALELIPSPEVEGQFYLVQKSNQPGHLILGPDEVFFPRRGLKNSGTGESADEENLNGGNSFASIEGWDEHDIAEWGIYFAQAGEIAAEVIYTGSSKFSLSIGDQKSHSVSSRPTKLQIEKPGMQTLRLECVGNAKSVKVSAIKLTGSPLEGSGIVRKRWRPAAAHTKFTNSRQPEQIRLWVMEMDAVPGELDFYCPITTPFGYYGPTWKADGTVNSSFNFSLWSFGRGQTEPPIEQLSHLIAIGNPTAKFGGFDHEGTGVKIRDWEPLAGRQGQRQALALRVHPGESYDTYFSYFYAHDEKRWRLFGAGKKWNKGKDLKSLWVGSFVEVPGPPPVQRTGPYPRTMRYRGWIMDQNQKWYPLDRMQNGNIDKETGLTHTNRGSTEDGRFFLSTGGWTFREPPNSGEEIALRNSEKSHADYLDPSGIEFLQTIPSSIGIDNVIRRGGRAQVTFQIKNIGENSEVHLYHGSEEGLTFADRWQSSVELKEAREGENKFILESVPATGDLYIRAFLRNHEGQFWSFDTYRIQ